MEKPLAQPYRNPSVAGMAKSVRRVGTVGHLRASLVGRPRASALPGEHDRRCHQLGLGLFCGARRAGSKLDCSAKIITPEVGAVGWMVSLIAPVHRCGDLSATDQRSYGK